MKTAPLLITALLLTRAFAAPISPDGQRVIEILDSMHVEEHWIAGAVVDWKTGDPTGKPITDNRKHTHCSQFTAAACDRLGVYILHYPEFRGALLANAQYDWLGDKGTKDGWSPVADAQAAQELANSGILVVAVFKNPDPDKSGHTAVIRPSTKSLTDIRAEGPDVTQAGGTNHNSCSLKEGFRNHPGAFKNNEIRLPPAEVPAEVAARELRLQPALRCNSSNASRPLIPSRTPASRARSLSRATGALSISSTVFTPVTIATASPTRFATATSK
jgi:hypothetical protein